MFKKTVKNLEKGQWCPTCTPLIGENIVRAIFEAAYKKKFPNVHLPWLIDPKRDAEINRSLSLDGYNEALRIGFEYNGQQHYVIHRKYTPNRAKLNDQKRKDRLKLDLCRKNNVKLAVIPEMNSCKFNDRQYVIDHVTKYCKLCGVILPSIPKNADIYTYMKTTPFDELKAYVRKKNGRVISKKWCGTQAPQEIRCEICGHIWFAIPADLLRNDRPTWCSKCAGNLRLSIDDCDLIASFWGGKCITRNYKNNHSKMRWQCDCTHIWSASYKEVSRRWCMQCKKSNPKKYTIDEIQFHIQKIKCNLSKIERSLHIANKM